MAYLVARTRPRRTSSRSCASSPPFGLCPFTSATGVKGSKFKRRFVKILISYISTHIRCTYARTYSRSINFITICSLHNALYAYPALLIIYPMENIMVSRIKLIVTNSWKLITDNFDISTSFERFGNCRSMNERYPIYKSNPSIFQNQWQVWAINSWSYPQAGYIITREASIWAFARILSDWFVGARYAIRRLGERLLRTRVKWLTPRR